jgi:hypothetical protein
MKRGALYGLCFGKNGGEQMSIGFRIPLGFSDEPACRDDDDKPCVFPRAEVAVLAKVLDKYCCKCECAPRYLPSCCELCAVSFLKRRAQRLLEGKDNAKYKLKANE